MNRIIQRLVLIPVLFQMTGCQLALNTGYAKGYSQTDSDKVMLGEVRVSHAIYKSKGNSGRIVVFVSHQSDFVKSTDDNNGINQVGIGLHIGNE